MSTGFYKIVKCPNEERNGKGQLVCYKKVLCWNYNKCTISKSATEQDLIDAGYVKREKVKPIKPYKDSNCDDTYFYYCPKCEEIIRVDCNYCYNCGSGIIWEDV